MKILTSKFTNFDFILTFQFPMFATELKNTIHILEIKSIR